MRLGKEDCEGHRRETAAATDIEDTGAGLEAAHLGDGQRMEDVTQVELVEILARNNVDLGVPIGIEVPQRGEAPLLLGVEVGKVFENRIHLFEVKSKR